MPNTWRKAYDELSDYIDKHPNIEIGMNVVAISEDVRPEFYRLFDTVRVNFIKDEFPASLEKGYALSKSFAEVKGDVTDSLGLEGINVRASVNWFLVDPVDGLMRLLFDPLFDLLKGKIDLAIFERISAQEVEEAFKDFFRDGYQRWVTLELVALLTPDKNYHVQEADYHTNTSMIEGVQGHGLREEAVPLAKEAKSVSFETRLLSSFVVPRVLVHSARLGRYAAMHSDFNDAHCTARLVSQNQEWLNIKDLKKKFGPSKLWPDLAIYTGEELGDMALVADYSRVARPDIIVEVMEEKDWFERGELELVKRHYHALQPKLGSFVVCREPVSEAALRELEPKTAPLAQATPENATPSAAPQPSPLPETQATAGQTTQPLASSEPEPVIGPALPIHLLSVGYDAAKLETIIEAITEAQKKSEGGS